MSKLWEGVSQLHLSKTLLSGLEMLLTKTCIFLGIPIPRYEMLAFSDKKCITECNINNTIL